MERIITLLLTVIILNGCASARSKYSDFDEFIAGKKNVDVVFDSIIFSDLEGSDLGFNVEKNNIALDLLSNAVEESLIELGYVPNVVYSGHGVFFEPEEEIKYSYSQNWQSIDQKYLSVTTQSNVSAWESAEMREYLQAIVQKAEEVDKLRSKNKSARNHSSDDSLVFSDNQDKVPDPITTLSADLLLYVQVDGMIKSLSKRIGQGLLTGAVSGVLTGGTFIVAAGSDWHALKIVAVDLSTNRIVWYHNRTTEGFKTIATSAITSFGYYPLIEGKYMQRGEKEARRERVISRQLKID